LIERLNKREGGAAEFARVGRRNKKVDLYMGEMKI
jgi:hypothetical protein